MILFYQQSFQTGNLIDDLGRVGDDGAERLVGIL